MATTWSVFSAFLIEKDEFPSNRATLNLYNLIKIEETHIVFKLTKPGGGDSHGCVLVKDEFPLTVAGLVPVAFVSSQLLYLVVLATVFERQDIFYKS